MEQLNAKVYRIDGLSSEGNGWYTGGNYYDLFKHDYFLNSYDSTFEYEFYSSEGMTVILIDIQRQIGWEPFKKTFRYFLDIDPVIAPTDEGEILKVFLTKLKDFSGEDVLSYINSRDKGVIEDWFDITLEYTELVHPPYYDDYNGGAEITIPKGSYTTYKFTPSESANYYIYTSPYSGSGVSNDTYIEVYTNSALSGTPIASNDDYDGGRFSKVNVAMTQGATYYIKVRHYSSGQLHTELNITRNAPTVNLTADGYQDIITANGEFALYKFTPDISAPFVFEVTNYNDESAVYDTYIKLYSNESMTQRIGGDETRVMVSLQANNTYYLKFSGYLMKYARGRINVRQGHTVQFSKATDRNFIYVNSPEYITEYDIIDDVVHEDEENYPCLKIFEQKNVYGQNTFYETHTAWWDEMQNLPNYKPVYDFYIDIDFYNPTSQSISVSILNLAYGNDYSILQQYYNGGHSYNITIAPYSHMPILSCAGAPLLCQNPNGTAWARTPVILFDFIVHSGNITVSSIAAYNPDNLYLRDETENVIDNTGAELDAGEIIYEYSKRPNETDLYGKIKGIARNESAWIDANIECLIDDNTNLGTAIPIYLRDNYYTYGISNPHWSWKSAISPINDKWNGVIKALPEGLHNFKYHYSNTNREWYFDFLHRDLRNIDMNSDRISINDPVPEQVIEYAKLDMASGQKFHFEEEQAPDEFSISIGEWGATYHYNITVNNSTDNDRTLCVKTWAGENVVFGVKKKGESEYTTSFYQSIPNDVNNPENTLIITVPKHETISFEFVTLLGAGLGGLNHSIVIE